MFKNQQGSALIVSMMVMSALTILALSTLRTTETQQIILRNTQLTTTAKNLALTEINAQIESINTNDPGETDQIVQLTLDSDVGNPVDVIAVGVNGIGRQSSAQGMAQEITSTLATEPSVAVPPPGFSIGSFENVTIEIRSIATLNGTASRSEQVQGYSYIKPAS